MNSKLAVYAAAVALVSGADLAPYFQTVSSIAQNMADQLSTYSSGIGGALAIQQQYDPLTSAVASLNDAAGSAAVGDVSADSVNSGLAALVALLDGLAAKADALKAAGAGQIVTGDLNGLATPAEQIVSKLVSVGQASCPLISSLAPGAGSLSAAFNSAAGIYSASSVSFVPVTCAGGASSAAPSSAEPSSAAPSSAAPSSAEPSSAAPSSAEPSSAAPSSAEPSSAAPSSAEPSSAAPSSAEPSSAEPSSAEPSSAEPSSAEPSSAEPSSAEPSSAEPSSAAPGSATGSAPGSVSVSASGSVVIPPVSANSSAPITSAAPSGSSNGTAPSSSAPSASSNGTSPGGVDTTITTVVTAYTTYCPEPTTFTEGTKTYTVTAPTTITVTDCPCTRTTVLPGSSAPPAHGSSGPSQPAQANSGSQVVAGVLAIAAGAVAPLLL